MCQSHRRENEGVIEPQHDACGVVSRSCGETFMHAGASGPITTCTSHDCSAAGRAGAVLDVERWPGARESFKAVETRVDDGIYV